MLQWGQKHIIWGTFHLHLCTCRKCLRYSCGVNNLFLWRFLPPLYLLVLLYIDTLISYLRHLFWGNRTCYLPSCVTIGSPGEDYPIFAEVLLVLLTCYRLPWGGLPHICWGTTYLCCYRYPWGGLPHICWGPCYLISLRWTGGRRLLRWPGGWMPGRK